MKIYDKRYLNKLASELKFNRDTLFAENDEL